MNEQIQSRPRGANQHVMWESRERQYCISIKTSYKKKKVKAPPQLNSQANKNTALLETLAKKTDSAVSKIKD
jgi:hypothetical protein